MMYSMRDACEQTGLSQDTIRYYEKLGLVTIKRKQNGHRNFTAETIDQLMLIRCLKKGGLMLEEMQPFLKLSETDKLSEHPALVKNMNQHREKIQLQIQDLQRVVDFINQKLTADSFHQAHLVSSNR